MRIIKKMFVLLIMILFSLLINKTNRCSASELCQINEVQTREICIIQHQIASELCQINEVQTSMMIKNNGLFALELCQINEVQTL